MFDKRGLAMKYVLIIIAAMFTGIFLLFIQFTFGTNGSSTDYHNSVYENDLIDEMNQLVRRGNILQTKINTALRLGNFVSAKSDIIEFSALVAEFSQKADEFDSVASEDGTLSKHEEETIRWTVETKGSYEASIESWIKYLQTKEQSEQILSLIKTLAVLI